MNFGVAGMMFMAVLILVGIVAGVVGFGDLAGIGVVYAGGVGLVCAACAGGNGPTFCDSANVRNHWRGHLQIAAVVVVIGLVGAAVTSLLS